MSWSYLSTSPGSSDRSQVRLRIGDTSEDAALLQDEEIDALLAMGGGMLRAAELAARTLGARYARRVDRTVGKLSIKYSEIGRHYFDLADAIKAEGQLTAGAYAGGISASDRASEEADLDRPARAFELGQFDNAAASESSR